MTTEQDEVTDVTTADVDGPDAATSDAAGGDVAGEVEACRCENSGFGERVCTEEGEWRGCACRCDGIWCDGVCVAYMTDVYNCGGCGHACPAGDICRNGICLVDAPVNPCPEGKHECDGDDADFPNLKLHINRFLPQLP